MTKALIILLWSLLPLARCFSVRSNPAITQDAPVLAVSSVRVSSRTMLRLFENEQEEEEKQSEDKIVGDGRDDASTIDSADLYNGLKRRKREIKRGIGKVRLLHCLYLQSFDLYYLLICSNNISITPTPDLCSPEIPSLHTKGLSQRAQ